MQRFHDCPQILRDFLVYHETIMGQSQLTISEYHLDLRMFLRFMKLMRNDMPIHTNLDDIPIKDIDIDFIRSITTSEIFDFLSYLSNDRTADPDAAVPTYGIAPAARARKLSALKSFYKYLTVRTKQLTENPVADLEYPKLRKSLPKYLTMEQSAALLQAVSGPNAKRDYAILMLFLNCGIRRSELVGLNLSDVYEDRIRVVGKGNKERIVPVGDMAVEALKNYLEVRPLPEDAESDDLVFLNRFGKAISRVSLFKIVKNALIFTALGIKRNLMAVLGIAAVLALMLSLIIVSGSFAAAVHPAAIIIPALILLSLISFMYTYAAWPVVDKYMIGPRPDGE